MLHLGLNSYLWCLYFFGVCLFSVLILPLWSLHLDLIYDSFFFLCGFFFFFCFGSVYDCNLKSVKNMAFFSFWYLNALETGFGRVFGHGHALFWDFWSLLLFLLWENLYIFSCPEKEKEAKRILLFYTCRCYMFQLFWIATSYPKF